MQDPLDYPAETEKGGRDPKMGWSFAMKTL
jgi:hypothetical protein